MTSKCGRLFSLLHVKCYEKTYLSKEVLNEKKLSVELSIILIFMLMPSISKGLITSTDVTYTHVHMAFCDFVYTSYLDVVEVSFEQNRAFGNQVTDLNTRITDWHNQLDHTLMTYPAIKPSKESLKAKSEALEFWNQVSKDLKSATKIELSQHQTYFEWVLDFARDSKNSELESNVFELLEYSD